MRQLFLLMIIFLTWNNCSLFSQENYQSVKYHTCRVINNWTFEKEQVITQPNPYMGVVTYHCSEFKFISDTYKESSPFKDESCGNWVLKVGEHKGRVMSITIDCADSDYLWQFKSYLDDRQNYKKSLIVRQDGIYLVSYASRITVVVKDYGKGRYELTKLVKHAYDGEYTNYFSYKELTAKEKREQELIQAERKRQIDEEMKLQRIEDEKRWKKEEEERLIELKKKKDEFLSSANNPNYYFEFENLSIKPEVEFDDLICDGIKDIVPTKNKRKTITFDIYFDEKSEAIKIKQVHEVPEQYRANRHPDFDLSPLLSYVSLDGKAVVTEQDVTRQVKFIKRDSISIQHSNVRAIINAPYNNGLFMIERTHTFCSECTINAKYNVKVEGLISNELTTAKGKYFEIDFSILRIVQGVEEKEWVEVLSVRKVKKSKDFLELIPGIDEKK